MSVFIEQTIIKGVIIAKQQQYKTRIITIGTETTPHSITVQPKHVTDHTEIVKWVITNKVLHHIVNQRH